MGQNHNISCEQICGWYATTHGENITRFDVSFFPSSEPILLELALPLIVQSWRVAQCEMGSHWSATKNQKSKVWRCLSHPHYSWWQNRSSSCCVSAICHKDVWGLEKDLCWIWCQHELDGFGVPSSIVFKSWRWKNRPTNRNNERCFQGCAGQAEFGNWRWRKAKDSLFDPSFDHFTLAGWWCEFECDLKECWCEYRDDDTSLWSHRECRLYQRDHEGW